MGGFAAGAVRGGGTGVVARNPFFSFLLLGFFSFFFFPYEDDRLLHVIGSEMG